MWTEIIQERWPDLWPALDVNPALSYGFSEGAPDPTLIIESVHLTSCYNRHAEAILQASKVPLASEKAWVYGVGLGDIQRDLLSRKSLKELNVVVLNPSVAVISFMSAEHEDWLEDPRVQLVLGTEMESPQKPFAVAPGCLRLASAEAATLKDQLRLELGAEFQNDAATQKLRDRSQSIENNREMIANDGDSSTLLGAHYNSTIVCVGGGPTLTDCVDWLTENRDEITILAVSTALRPLLNASIVPDYVTAVDHNPYVANHLEGVDHSLLSDVPLLYAGEVNHAVMERWAGPRLGFYLQFPRYDELRESIARLTVWCSGTVAHSAVDLAVKMGAARVILVGFDFCYAKQRAHAKGSYYDVEEEVLQTAHDWVLNADGEAVPSTLNFISYLRDLETYIEKCTHVEFRNTGREAAVIRGAEWLENVP